MNKSYFFSLTTDIALNKASIDGRTDTYPSNNMRIILGSWVETEVANFFVFSHIRVILG